MDKTAGQQGSATRVVVVAAALLAVALASVKWPPLVSALGLVVVAGSLVLTPVMTLALSLAALMLAAVSAWITADPGGGLRVLNVAIGGALAVSIGLVLDRRARSLASSRQREEDVLSAMPEAVVVLDGDGVLRRANRGLSRLVGAAQVGQPLHALTGHLRADGSTCDGGCALAGVAPDELTTAPFEGERISRDGRAVPIAYTVGRYGDDALVVTIRDVSARVAAQEDREVLLDAAARADEQAALLRTLGGPTVRGTPPADVLTDIWHPGGNEGVGGGLTSLTTLPDGRCLLLLANGEGAGYEAMRDAWKVLYVARAHLAAGAPLAEMITRASADLADESDAPSATVVGVLIDPVTGYLQVASGGHPPPLLVHADGSSSWIDAAGRPLGEADPGSIRVASAEVGAGDSLLVYGSGMIDAGGDVIEGLSALRSAAVALRAMPLTGLAERIGLAAVSPGAGRDEADVLMVLRLAPG